MKKFFALMPKNNKECMVEWSTSNSLKVKYLLNLTANFNLLVQ